jgi:phage/plasmid-like protein (TIGR03299 family)
LFCVDVFSRLIWLAQFLGWLIGLDFKGEWTMAAAVESMMYFGATPWHGLGNPVSEDAAGDVAQSIQAAGLDWEVNKEQLQTSAGEVVPGAWATIRQNDRRALGVVGDQYTVLQNRDAFNWFQPFLDTKQVRFETAGSLHNGEIVWAMAKLAGNLEVGKGDDVAKYLLLAHSHSGRLKVQISTTPIRVVCQNTLRMAQQDSRTKLFSSIRHTRNMETRLNDAREDVAKANHLFMLSLEKYQFLASKRADMATVDQYFRKVLDISEDKTVELSTRNQNRLDNLKKLFFMGKGSELQTSSGTWWGAYNAVTEYQTWEHGRTRDNRLESLWFGKDDALDVALQMATAA